MVIYDLFFIQMIMKNINYDLGNIPCTHFSLNLKRRRLELGISRIELATELGIDTTTLDKYEGINNIFIAISNEEIVKKIKYIFKRVEKENQKIILNAVIQRIMNPKTVIQDHKNIPKTTWQNQLSHITVPCNT